MRIFFETASSVSNEVPECSGTTLRIPDQTLNEALQSKLQNYIATNIAFKYIKNCILYVRLSNFITKLIENAWQ